MPKVSDSYRDARRSHILAAAATCFSRNGFHATSMQDIFREAEISPGAFYRYFATKADLIADLALETAAALEHLIDEAVRAGDSPPEVIDELIRSLVSFERRTGRGHMAVQLWSEAARDDTVRKIVLGLVERIVGKLTTITGAEAQARVVFAVLQGLTLQLVWQPDLDAEQLARATHVLLKGPVGGQIDDDSGLRT